MVFLNCEVKLLYKLLFSIDVKYMFFRMFYDFCFSFEFFFVLKSLKEFNYVIELE